MSEKGLVVLELTDGQKAKLGQKNRADCNTMIFPVDPSAVLKYRVPDPDVSDLDWLELTAGQVEQLKKQTGEDCRFIPIDGGVVPLYGVVPFPLDIEKLTK